MGTDTNTPLEYPRRDIYPITARGLGVLKALPDRIDIPYLMQFPEMVEWRRRRSVDDEGEATSNDGHASGAVELTPDEQILAGYRRLDEDHFADD